MDISNTIQDLVEESQRPKKARVQEVGPLVSTICDRSYEAGLSNKDLESIIKLVREPTTLDQTAITNLIKSLYPAQKIPSSCASLIVAALGPSERKPSPATQNLLLWWLTVVRTALEEWNVLEKLYSILFNLLDTLMIRTNLCRVLCMITRRKHVKPWRIHRLHELSQSASNDQALNALLKVYQNFYPDVIVPQGKSMEIFKGMDKEWIARLNAIQEQNELNTGKTAVFEVIGDGHKRRRTEIIPRLQTRQIHENTVVLEELRSIEDFGNKYERIEYPNQIIAALDNQQLQRLVVLRDDPVLIRRLNDWLTLVFDSHLQGEGDDDSDKVLAEVISQLEIFTRQTKIVPEAFLAFLPRYLEQWKGQENRSAILQVVAYLDLQPFDFCKRQFLNALEQALLDASETGALDILTLYTMILNSWTVALSKQSQEDRASQHDASTTIIPLISHCSVLVLQILSTNPTPQNQAIVQEYVGALANQSLLVLRYTQLHISIPPPLQVYLLLFASSSLHSLSSLSDMLCIYKETLEHYLPNQKGIKGGLHFPRSSVGEFNGYIMDICNLIWRGRGFNTTDNNAMGCLVPQDVVGACQQHLESIPLDRKYSLSSIFTLSFHPILSALAIQTFRDMEDRVIADHPEEEEAITERHAGPVTQRSLSQLVNLGGLDISWNGYRTEVIDVLAAMGADGLPKLIRRNIKVSN